MNSEFLILDSPATAASDSAWIMPGRKMRGGETDKSRTVDSMPTCDWPPSTINEIFSPSRAPTCSAFVGEIWLDRFALGAASGKPHSRITACMNGWLGQRMPTVAPPAVTLSGISSARGNTKVSGPGQNALENFPASSGHALTQAFAISLLATWTMMGLCAGRPLI